jgi:hypothetical protein
MSKPKFLPQAKKANPYGPIPINEPREGNIDLAVVTRQPKSPGGHVLRSEQLIWAASQQIGVEHRSVLPLALFPEGYCVIRELTLEPLRAVENMSGQSGRANSRLSYRQMCTNLVTMYA